ncbi:TonB-dependent siderophore receptor [Tistrella bauzanensis]|uniref:TonB-dependent siderophore receptor n=1 Tax=Tistrella TaxID=171436 RepID=UPI0031F6ADC0
MRQGQQRRQRVSPGVAAMVAASMATGPGAIGVAGLVAGMAMTAAGAARAADAAAEVSFDIPAQPLAGALGAFGRQAGLQVSADTAVTRGVESRGLHGRMTAEAGLTQLLAGTPVAGSITADGVVVLQRLTGDGATVLDPLQVAAARVVERATGPVAGYVATRTATATKTDTPLLETPQSVSVVTRDQMAARAVTTEGEALAYTAGVRVGGRAGGVMPGGDNIQVRGFGGDGTYGASSNEYLDGIKVGGTNFGVGGFEPYLFERIEVLKGPASVLYGQNTPGGIVNRVSKTASEQAVNEVMLRGGSFGRHEAGADIGGRLVADGRLAFRVAGLVMESDNQVDGIDQERTAIAPSLTWRAGDDTTLTLLGAWQRDDIDGGFSNMLPIVGTLYEAPYGRLPRDFYAGDTDYGHWDRDLYTLGYQFEHRFDDAVTFRQNARYIANRLDFATVYIKELKTDGVTLDRNAFAARESSNVYVVDNQIQIDGTTGPLDHTLLAGLEYRHHDSDTIRRFAQAGTIVLPGGANKDAGLVSEPAIYQNLETRRDQWGIYVQDQVRIGGWIVNLGGRYDRADSRVKNRLTSQETSQDDEAFTTRVGLGYAFDTGLTPYVSYAESFEPHAGTVAGGGDMKPTRGTQYEAGLKYQPSGWNTMVTAAVFHLTQTNVPKTDTATNVQRQIGEVTNQGIELEAVASLGSGWDVQASFTWLDSEVTESTEKDLHNRPTMVPEVTAALWGRYTFQAGFAEGLGLGAGVRYVGSTYGDEKNTIEVPSYTLYDAAVTYDLGRAAPSFAGVELAVNASNLFDETYVSGCEVGRQCYWGQGRSVLGTVKYKW